jgi:hypothetical protein
MDGTLLVFDARTLPNMHALAPVDVPVAPKAPWRHRTFPAMAALILATVLSLVYFVSTQRTAPVSAPIPSLPQLQSSGASTTAASRNAAPPADTNQTPPPAPAAPEVKAATVTTKDEKTTPAANTSAAKKAIAKTPTTQRPPEEPKKDDSKVGSILKKTGRLLKKPFKF